MKRSTVRIDIADGIAWLTLDSGTGNRIDEYVAGTLCDACDEIERDERVIVTVLSASGRDFCRGLRAGGAWEERHDWVRAVGELTMPVLAAVQGEAAAEGCELALAGDLRIVTPSSRFRLSQIARGVLPRHGGTQRLPRLVGRMRAMDLLLEGRPVDGREAVQIGMASLCVPSGRLLSRTRALARRLARHAPFALRLAKEAVCKGSDMTFEQGMRLEQDLYVLLQTTDDRREGVRAFLEKRSPRFSGR